MQKIVDTESPLLEILAGMAPGSSKTTLRSWLKEERVAVDGQVVKRGDILLKKGQKVTVGAKVQYIGENIRIIYQDAHLIAIDKPSGMLSVATAFEKGETAHALLKGHFHPRKVYVVHRLDQDTSGVILFALSEKGYEGLKQLFEKHDIERSYCAIVEGIVKPEKGTWQSFLYEDSQYMVHSTPNADEGSLAITHYRVENHTSRFSRLILNLETGKKNQIRVHCQDHGHPVVGDKKYGAGTDSGNRLCLHAQSIAFVHPVTGKKMRFSSPVPEVFNRLVKEKNNA